MNKTELLQIRITPELKQQLQEAAQAEGRTVSGYVLWLIQRELNNREEK